MIFTNSDPYVQIPTGFPVSLNVSLLPTKSAMLYVHQYPISLIFLLRRHGGTCTSHARISPWPCLKPLDEGGMIINILNPCVLLLPSEVQAIRTRLTPYPPNPLLSHPKRERVASRHTTKLHDIVKKPQRPTPNCVRAMLALKTPGEVPNIRIITPTPSPSHPLLDSILPNVSTNNQASLKIMKA